MMTPQEMINKAEVLARKAHAGQTRKKSTQPYFVHPQRVAHAIRSHGGTPTMIAAAYLHDVIKDGPEGVDIELSRFPLRVRELVERLTRRKGMESKLEYLERIKASGDTEAILIKIADRIDNIRDGATSFGREWLTQYLADTARLVCAASYCGITTHPLVKELVATMDRWG